MVLHNKSSRLRASIKSVLVLSVGSLFSLSSYAGAIIYSDADDDISDTVAAFQVALGNPNNGNSPGPIANGRRQINWDAGIVPFDMPGDFFNNTVFPPTRGAVFSNDNNNEFRVSNDGTDNEFDSFNADNPDQFTTFSAPRLFAPVGTTVFDVHFFTPAGNAPATVNGFGAIFSDIDLADSTMVDLFDINNQLISSYAVDANPEGLSFFGVTFDDLIPPIYRVSITAGNTDIGLGMADDPFNGIDLVVLDDLLYGEPQAVSEPGALAFLSAGLLVLYRRRKHRLQTH